MAAAVPQYEIEGELGRGGWGIVLGARHRQLAREVAIKQLPRAFAADPLVRRRFAEEARLVASLDHPHIIPVFDYIEQDGLCLLIMERLDGGTVWERFTSRGLAPDEACTIVLATCAGLEAAHHRGILHRDIKPENLMFSSAGTLKITDFGVAKVLAGGLTLATRAGEVLGTPVYMAPEQAQDKQLSPATDVYAVGTMLYELLAGRLPFEPQADALQVLYAHAFESPRPLKDVAPTVPDEMAAAIMKALATAPEDRYPTAEALGVALAQAATDAWGLGWLNTSLTPVMANGAIMAATERLTAHAIRPPARATIADQPVATPAPTNTPEPAAAAPAPRRAPPTEVVADVPSAPGLETPGRVRPAGPVRNMGVGADAVSARDLVPVGQVVERRAPTTPFVVSALALLMLTGVVAFIGLGSPLRGPSLAPGTVTVDGTSLGSGHTPVPLDLSRPVNIDGTVPPGASVDRLKLIFSVVGIPIAAATTTISPGSGGTFAVSLDETAGRYLVPRRTTGRVELLFGGRTVASERFSAMPKQPSFATVPSAVAIVMVLFALAFAESLLRSLRQGHKRVVGPPGMAIVGAAFGISAALLSWLARAGEPTIATLVASAALGGAAGAAAAFAARRIGGRGQWRTR